MESLETILADLKILAESAQEDLDANRSHSHPEYVDEFNSILRAVQDHGLVADASEIGLVPPGRLSSSGAGYGLPVEFAKLREVINRSAQLLRRLESSLGSSDESSVAEVSTALERLCTRFHLVARQLRSRRQGRSPLEIEDEYDVQDLFHALLWVYFDDIRPEEWTPSYAGGSARMDFLLKDERTVVEVKKTRKGLGDRELGDELMVDIERYAHHGDCRSLVCFVYDPEGRVSNPRGVEADLMSRSTDELEILVFVRPTGQ